MHQVKTQSSRREPQAEMTSSKASIRRKTVGGKEQYHENAKTNTKELGIFFYFLYKVLPLKFRKLDNSSIGASERIRGASNFMPPNRVRNNLI